MVEPVADGMSRLPSGLDLDGGVFLVAGAGGGIGRAVTELLCIRGANLVCADLDEEECERSVDIAVGAGGDAVAVTMDARDPRQANSAVSMALSRWGRLSGLVNCVGITGETGVDSADVSLDDFRRVLDINLVGAFVLSQSVLGPLRESGYGRILHIASIAGKDGNPGMVSYSASKAGLIGMVKSMGKEYAQDGITVNALAPAVIWTPMVEAMPQTQVDYMTERIPMGRLGRLEEVAEMAAWIVSPAASFTTGFTFDLTGGRATY